METLKEWWASTGRTKRIVIAAAVLFVVAIIGNAAFAQGTCAPLENIERNLLEKYGESLAARGLNADGSLMTIWVNAESGTWTATMSAPDGWTCIRASGQAFEFMNDPLEPAGMKL